MADCARKQRERRGDQVLHRCLNPKADDYKKHVDDSTCEACPVRVLLRAQAVPELPVIDDGPYPPCQFRASGHCTATGLPVTSEICTRCDQTAAEHVASAGDKIKGYAQAVKMWVAAGRPTRIDEEVEQIYSEHCSKCDKFDSATQSCKSCGCSVKVGGFPLSNKLKMATEHCPIGRF